MNTLKVALLATVTTLALASPSFAQNFQGMGAPSWATENTAPATQDRQVSMQNHKAATAKHQHTTAK